MSRVSRVALVLMLCTLGCANLIDRLDGRKPTASPGAAWMWSGKDCPDNHDVPIGPNQPDENRAFSLLCTEYAVIQSSERSRDLETRHAGLDDRRPDQLTLGVMVLTCARFCEPQERIHLAMTAGLARLVDPAALRVAVDRLPWSNDAKTFFTEKVRQAGALLTAWAETLDARRKALYVDLPKTIRADRQRYFAAHARAYAALDALSPEASHDDPALGDKLVALRARYLAECGSPDCRFDPFVVEVTKHLVLTSIATGDELTATVEGMLFAEPSVLRNAHAPMIHRAQYLEMKQEEQRWEAYDRAKRDGNDDATLAARFGPTPPIHITADSAWSASDAAPSLWRGSPAKLDSVTGIVAGIRVKGDRAEVSFADTFSKYVLEDCVDTNRVDAIGSDGKVYYRQRCRKVGTRTERHSTPPVWVPRRDVASVRAREELTALVGDDLVGGVVAVRNAKAELVQFRMHRLRPDARYAMISRAVDVDPGKQK